MASFLPNRAAPLRPLSNHKGGEARWREGASGFVAVPAGRAARYQSSAKCCKRPVRTLPESKATDEAVYQLAAVSARPGAGRARRGGAACAHSRSLSPARFRRGRRRFRVAPRYSLSAAQGSPAGRISGRARSPRRADRRARLFPVRHQAGDGQELHHRRVRAEADDRDRRGGEGRKMAARTDRDRHAARLSGRRHRAAGGRRRDRRSISNRATTSKPARCSSTSTIWSSRPTSPTASRN